MSSFFCSTVRTRTLPNKQVLCSSTLYVSYSSSLCLPNGLKVLLFVHSSITEEEVEHILHMNRDAVWNSIVAVHLLSLLCGGQLLVCANDRNTKSCTCEQTLCKHTHKNCQAGTCFLIWFIYSKSHITLWWIIYFCISTSEPVAHAHEHFPANQKQQTCFLLMFRLRCSSLSGLSVIWSKAGKLGQTLNKSLHPRIFGTPVTLQISAQLRQIYLKQFLNCDSHTYNDT